jgi:hypothetical protein
VRGLFLQPAWVVIAVSALDALFHFLNFFAPAWGVAALAAALAKLVWWKALRSRPWWRLALVCGVVNSAVWLGCLLLSGRDGKMSSYGLLVLATALTLAWRGWGSAKA